MERLTERDEYDYINGRKGDAFTYTAIRFCGDCYVGEVIDKLADYEDLEEQGLLLRLPCPIGTTVYVIYKEWEEIYDGDSWYYDIYEEEFHPYMLEGVGKEIFLTYEEAETKLRELQSEVAENE